MHLHLHIVSTFHPHAERSLLHPVVHLAKKDLPVALRCHLLPIELLDRVEALAHSTVVQCGLQMLTAAFVPLRKLQSGTASLIEVKSLAQESFTHLVADLVCSIHLIVRGFVHLGPLVEILLQVALLHDFGPSVETGTT